MNKSMIFLICGWSVGSFFVNETLLFGAGALPLGHHNIVLEDGPGARLWVCFPGYDVSRFVPLL